MSSQSRVDMLALTDARERAAQCGIPDAMAELSVFRIALHQPPVAVALHGMLEALLWKGALDARLRELIIMRIGWVTDSVYEWTQHWRVARLLDVEGDPFCGPVVMRLSVDGSWPTVGQTRPG